MQLRQATINDCADLAILDNIAGHGLPLWLWQNDVSESGGGNALEIGRDRFLDQSKPCNWTNAVIAEIDGEPAGAAVGYHLPTEMPVPTGSSRVMAPLHRLFPLAVGTWVVDAVGVYSRFRRRGIARSLLRDQIARAGETPVSIVAANDNAPALALYRSERFAEVAREPFVPFNNTQTTTSWLLLRRQANR